MGKRALSFIHCADLHLDSPFKGLGHLPNKIFSDIRQGTFKAFDNIIEHAITNQVNFVLIVGDLFDGEIRSLKAQMHVKKAFEKLQENGIEVFVSHGNHDYINENFHSVSYPDNVHVFPSEQVTYFDYHKENVSARIYGFSYENRAVYESKASEYKKTGEFDYHIATLHGSINTNTTHDVYAPFKIQELKEKEFDYWALGHIHQRDILAKQPYIVYPGNPQARHMKEAADKSCTLMELSASGAQLQLLPTDVISFQADTIDATSCGSIEDIHDLVMELKASFRKPEKHLLLKLSLEIDRNKLNQSIDAESLNELLDILNEGEEEEISWIWINELAVKEKNKWDRKQLLKGQHFVGELLRTIDSTKELQEELEPLFHHRQSRKYLKMLDEKELNEVKENAEKLLIDLLLNE